MFRNYLKIAIRVIKRQKAYSFINIAGLTIGLTVSLTIAFYVIDDLTYDTFHEDADDIYRMLMIENSGNSSMTYSITVGPLLPESKEKIPEVVAATRAFGTGRPFVAAGDVPRNEMNESNSVRLRGLITEPEFFDVFSFKILRGDNENALDDPNGILLTYEAAEALFGKEDPIGQRISFPFNIPQEPYIIGIVEKPPLNSHIQYDYIIPLKVENNPLWWDSWENLMLQGYVKLSPGASQKSVEDKMLAIARANNMPEVNIPKLQPLLDVHLGSAHHRYDGTNRGKNDETVVYALAVIGLLIILVASINFINLSSARASKRAREVGMRKVIGSTKSALVIQFLAESVFLTTIAMALSIIILQITLPYLDELLGKQLNVSFIDNPLLLISLLAISVVIGILSGLYPAFVISSFKPVTVLRGDFQKSSIGTAIRKGLVLVQFAVTIFLISGVLVIMDQIEYLKSMDMGYNRDQVITTFAPNNQRDLLKNRVSALPGVKTVGRSSGVLGSDFIRYEVIPEGYTRDDSQMFLQIAADESFFETLEIEMAEGRGFSADFPSDTMDAVLVNETAVKKAGWDQPLGKRLEMVEIDGTITAKHVVGVVKDFHFTSARQEIEPLFFQLNTQNTFLILIKLAGGSPSTGSGQRPATGLPALPTGQAGGRQGSGQSFTKTIAGIEEVYKEIYPNNNFNYQFLDDQFNQQFQNDRDFATNIAYFSGFAIFIACLGLVGLVAFAVDQRKAEIAVRKVLGSSEVTIIYLLSKDFLKWVLIANIIAWPLSYYAIGLWLDSFVYKVTLSPFPFLFAGIAALLIAFLTMLYQSIKASYANPVDALRNN